MATRVFGATLFRITSQVIIDQCMIGGGMSNERLYFAEYRKTALVCSPLLKKNVFIYYNEFQTLTDLGLGNLISIEVVDPIELIKHKFIELGCFAQLRCEEALCLKVERVYMNNVSRR